MAEGTNSPEMTLAAPATTMEAKERVQLFKEPVKNQLETFRKLYYWLRKTTRDRSGGLELPLHIRHDRAETLKHYKQETDPLKKAELIKDSRKRKQIAKEFMRQGFLERTDGVSAKYTFVEPPESKRGSEYSQLPPIFLLPGIGNDLEAVSSFAQELAVQGRKVYVIGYPETYMGTVTQQFVDELEKSLDFGPQTDFFKQAITTLAGNSDIELWGFSAGGPIASEIMNDSDFQKRITNAILVNPSCSVDLNFIKGALGVALEGINIGKTGWDALRWTLTGGRKTPDEKDQPRLKKIALDIMGKKLLQRSEAWKTARVNAGGRILVVSAGRDPLTESSKVFNPGNIEQLRADNPQIDLLPLPESSHAAPNTRPGETVRAINAVNRFN